MLKDHYEAILAQLKQDMFDIAERYPDSAVNLRQPNSDPDVARLLEGVALLAARQRQVLEQDQEEFSQGWLQAVAPDLLKPVPALAMAAMATPTEVKNLAQACEFNADAGQARIDWRVAKSVQLLPIELVSVQQSAQRLTFTLNATGSWVWDTQLLGLQWIGEIPAGRQFMQECLTQASALYIESAHARRRIDKEWLQLRNGFEQGSWLALLSNEHDQSAVPQWLKETLIQPLRALAIDIPGNTAKPEHYAAGDTISLHFELDAPIEHAVKTDAFSVNAVPLVNLKSTQMLPFQREQGKSLYELSLVSPNDQVEQLVCVDQVTEINGDALIEYSSLNNLAAATNRATYQLVEKETQPRFQLRVDRQIESTGLIKANVWIHQGDATAYCSEGDLVQGNEGELRLVAQPSHWLARSQLAQVQQAHWQSQNLASQPLSLATMKAFFEQLLTSSDNHQEQARLLTRWVESMLDLQIKPSSVTRGTSLIIGQHASLSLSFNALSKADAWWLGTLTWQWLRSRLSINSVLAFSLLNDKGMQQFYWPHATGTRALI